MAGQALRGPRGPVHRDGREGLPGTQAALHPVVLWVPGQDHPWVVLTDEAPDAVDLGAYGLRVWIEQGFRTLKRMGWQWHRTRRLDPARVDRHWLVLAYGTRVEEARLRGRAPGRVRRPPPEPAAPDHRPLRDDYVFLRSERTEPGWVINLGSYFDCVRSFAYDDVFVARYLLRKIDTLLSNVVNQPERQFNQHLLADIVDRISDSFALLGKLVRSCTLMLPPHRVISGYLEARDSSYILPGSVVEFVPYGPMFAEYNVEDGATYDPRWCRFVGRLEKYNINGSEAYMIGVLRFLADAPNAKVVFFRMSDLLTMFKDLRDDLNEVSDNTSSQVISK